MKYNEKYPNAGTERWDWADVQRGIFKTKDANPCGHCGEHTHFIDVNLQAPICSEECEEAYIHAMNESNERSAQAGTVDSDPPQDVAFPEKHGAIISQLSHEYCKCGKKHVHITEVQHDKEGFWLSLFYCPHTNLKWYET
ncbi:hypothetical protein D3C85_703830 [compost metagenome]